MLAFGATALLFWFACGLLSALSRDDRPYAQAPGFAAIGLCALFPCLLAVIWGAWQAGGAHPGYVLILVVIAIIPGVMLALPWLRHIIGQTVEEAGRTLMGADSMPVRRSYDAAERLLHEQKFDEAERAYLAGAGEETEDPEPLRGAGQAALAAGRATQAVAHFRGALMRTQSEEDRASLAIRIAEIEERKLGDAAAARRTLEALLPDLSPGKWGDYVRERLKRLNQESRSPNPE